MVRCAAARVIMGGVRVGLSGVEVVIGDSVEQCEVEIVSVGAYVLAITTVIPGRGRLLASSFLIDLAGRAAVAHMWDAGGEPRRFDHATIDLIANRQARACVLEHVAHLQERLAGERVDGEVRVALDARVLVDAADVWLAES